MALVYLNRARETTTTTGTGTITLAGAVAGHQAISGIGNGNVSDFFAIDANGTGWESFRGTWSTGGSLTRDSTYASSNSGSSISLSAGTHQVFIMPPSNLFVGTGANTFTALQTITQAAANAGIMASTGYSLTGSNASNMLDFAGTWNTSGNPVAFRLAITNTASGATSKFASFLAGAAGATEVFYVDKQGRTLAQTSGCFNVGTLTTYSFATDSTSAFRADAAGVGIVSSLVAYANNVVMGWSSNSSWFNGIETGMARNAAGVLEINNGSAGTFRDLKLRNLIGQTGYHELAEMTAPGVGASDTARIYAVDNGAGKTQLMVIFASGAAQQLAIQP